MGAAFIFFNEFLFAILAERRKIKMVISIICCLLEGK
jgi:hypothetical protein